MEISVYGFILHSNEFQQMNRVPKLCEGGSRFNSPLGERSVH